MSKVTFICTSCGRPDLLDKTLTTFLAFNTYPIEKYIVYEDSGIIGINNSVKEKFPFIEFIEPEKRLGQIIAQDCLWDKVQTEYVLQWEEDWETYKHSFVEKALPILEDNPKLIQVLFRHPMDINKHPTIAPMLTQWKHREQFRLLSTSHTWKGFSFAPSLKRLSDYKRIESYSKYTTFNKEKPWQSEHQLGLLYYKLGYVASVLKEGFVRHIGQNRHVK